MKRTLMMLSAMMLAGGATGLAGGAQTAEPAIAPAQAEAPRARRAEVGGRGFLGVELDEVDAEAARRLGLRQERGALITSVVENSSAATAGLQKDDVVVKWDGEAVESAMELSRLLRETPSGRVVKLTVVRGGREIDVEARLGNRIGYARVARPTIVQAERPARIARPARPLTVRPATVRPARAWTITRARLGVQLGAMNEQLAEYFGVKAKGGSLVLFVHADSPAAKAGLKAGDVIISVAGKAIEGAFDVHEALGGKEEGPVEVKVVRERQERTLTVQLEKDGTTSWNWGPDTFEPGDLVITPMPTPALTLRPLAPNLHAPRIMVAPIATPRVAIPALKMPVVKIRPRVF